VRLSDHDASDEQWRCVPLKTLDEASKLAYYAWKLWSIVKIPPPI
jgi:hypothetical protein